MDFYRFRTTVYENDCYFSKKSGASIVLIKLMFINGETRPLTADDKDLCHLELSPDCRKKANLLVFMKNFSPFSGVLACFMEFSL